MLKQFRATLAEWLAPGHTHLAVHETDDTITTGSTTWAENFRNRFDYKRAELLEQAINARRGNPIAKRIIEITTEFVIGDGFSLETANDALKTFLDNFWHHPRNDLDTQLAEWADEAWSTGDLFLLVSLDPGGFPYVRAVPAEVITDIKTAENDYRQELYYLRGQHDEQPYPSYEVWKSAPTIEPFMLHFPLNRMVGSCFGESDLFSVLYWIKLYQGFLENRARLNHFRNLFAWIIQRAFKSDPEKAEYLNNFTERLPKKAGGVIALGVDENLSVVNANLGSFEAEQDGLALKRMIATGVGLPLHYLAEPEGATRTTADAAGTPTFKRFKRRQEYLKNVLRAVLTVAAEVRRQVETLPGSPITISAPDVTERDNANLAMGVQRITAAFIPLYNAGKITAQELIRLVYRFLAETPPESIPDETSPIYANAKAPQADPPEPDPVTQEGTDAQG